MSSYSISGTQTSSITNARRLASKVATDLARFQRFYRSPSDKSIADYEAELTLLLNYDAVDNVVYGFKRNGLWTLASVRYVALPGGVLQTDDDPGRIKANLDISGASFTSFLSYSSNWFARSSEERANIKKQLPFDRTTGESPNLERGQWIQDKNYSSGGLGLGRSTVRT
ncbi:hypothetical protein [Roseibium aggregatum]|uniref:HORMA-1 domain-containing protein n=1 Tax=Roseibium aggregatum TaxID=187304 RepID=UPI001A8F24DE|nr:hypothetical protein [Roseibium aggregatum]MBN8183119.1 hypothetical protein [Roseibium aggregatum]